ncbi:hypothetical protein KSS87_012868 [Heliosperma pusillum]|nr:hypothetical protein KSS87_012868 [Heliosperma pusillum]
MMGYKESIAQELSLGDPLFQRIHNLRPLIPNSYLSPPNHNHLSNSCLHQLHHHHDFGTNNKGLVEDCKEGSPQQVMVSSRWNPTPEQLTALEELYRCGTRTPSAEQIQHITAQLRRYGKIEGKNVFYWFQNHKARERQKRRRQLQPHVNTTTTSHANHVMDNKGFEEEEEKNGKRALFITNNKESDSEAPIESTANGPRKSDNSSNSLQCLFQFHHQPSAQQFQHNYNPNNTLCPTTSLTTKQHFFLSDQGNATWPPPPPTTTTTHFTIIQPPLHLFSLPSTATTAADSSGRGDGVATPTLQLFPVLKPGGDDGENGDLKKDNGEVISLLSHSKDENVPYYQFL